MAHGPEVKEKVRSAYVYQRQSIEIAALAASVSVRTAQNWRAKAADTPEDWDKARAMAGLSSAQKDEIGRELLDNFLISFKSSQEAVLNGKYDGKQKAEILASLAYTFEGMMRTLKKMMPDVNRAVVAKEIIDDLADFIAKDYPQHLPVFVDILGPFAKHLAGSIKAEKKKR